MASTANPFFALAAASLLIATMLGAYASHGMASAAPAALDAVRTAVAYQFYHGLSMLVVPLLAERLGARIAAAAGWLFATGTLLFCGAIYASDLLGWEPVGSAAPFGGMAFIAGWATLLIGALRAKSAPRS